MAKEKHLNITFFSRNVILFIVLATLFFSFLGYNIFKIEKKKLVEQADLQLYKSLKTLTNIVKFDINYTTKQNIDASQTLKVFYFENRNIFDFNKKHKNYRVINIADNTQLEVPIELWKYKNNDIIENSRLFKQLALSLENDIIIAQKTKGGFVIINSTIPELNLKFIPISSNLAFTIENNENFHNELNISGTQYLLSAFPIFNNNKIAGFLGTLKEKKLSKNVDELFFSEQFFKRGYSFVMDQEGKLIVHPYLEGVSLADTKIYKKIISFANGDKAVKIEYIWPENEFGEKKIMYIKYAKDIKLYIGSTYYLTDLLDQLKKLKIFLFLSVIFSLLIFISSVLILVYQYYKKFNTITFTLNEILKGKYYLITGNKLPVEQLANKLTELSNFTQALNHGNYNYKYEPWSQYDKIGKNLVNLRDRLQQKEQEERQKEKEQEEILWLNKGLSKFIEILKYQVIDIKELSYKIISEIVEYIGANEGGFFIVSEENGTKYLELLAAYAMSKERLIKRKIPFGVGFVGRVAIEKELLYITEVPDNYYKISTALGQVKPQSIIILPLLFNNEIIGIVEINSLKKITELQIQFLKHISENISANLAMWSAGQQTAELLEETQKQAKILEEQRRKMQEHIEELNNLRQESEQREIELSSIIKAVNTTAILVEYDKDGYITDVNDKFLNTIGKKKEEIIGKHHSEISSMDVKTLEYKRFWQELIAGKSKKFIEALTFGDKTIWLSENYVPITDKDGNILKIFNIAIDITENKILEKQLRNQVKEISKEARAIRKEERKIRKERQEFEIQNKNFNAILLAIESYIGILEFTIDGTITKANSYFAKLLDIKDTSAILNMNLKDIIASEDTEKLNLAIEALKTKEKHSGTLKLIKTKENFIEINYTLVAVKDNRNKIINLTMTLTQK